MAEVVVFIICLILITIGFIFELKTGEKKKKPKEAVIIPEVVQVAFRNFADKLLAEKEILLEEAKIKDWQSLEAVSYEQGIFKYYRIEYSLMPQSPVETTGGMILNSREILERFGFKGDMVALFYEENEDIFEISFLPETQITMMGGCRAYIDTRYNNTKIWVPLEEYSMRINGIQLTLFENMAEKPMSEELIATRHLAEGDFASTAQYTETLENDDIEISSWIQFERKRELIYSLRAKTNKIETFRGIHTGCTVQELKEKYPSDLSYNEDLNGNGPAYGYIPQDGTDRYIAFKANEEIISEIFIANGFGVRPFQPEEGYVDQDIPWIEDSYEEKLTEKYARALYLGQHKMDSDPKQVFNQYVTKNFESISVVKKGLWKDNQKDKEQIYFVICENPQDKSKLYVEIKLTQIHITKYTNNTIIWVVTHHRSQKKRG